jgi:hypothetical protein
LIVETLCPEFCGKFLLFGGQDRVDLAPHPGPGDIHLKLDLRLGRGNCPERIFIKGCRIGHGPHLLLVILDLVPQNLAGGSGFRANRRDPLLLRGGKSQRLSAPCRPVRSGLITAPFIFAAGESGPARLVAATSTTLIRLGSEAAGGYEANCQGRDRKFLLHDDLLGYWFVKSVWFS